MLATIILLAYGLMVSVAVADSFRRERNSLEALVSIRLLHIEALEKTLHFTGAALGREKEVKKAIFDMLLLEIAHVKDVKEENARLVRELAMAEETIHVLTPARDDHGRFINHGHVCAPLFDSGAARLSGTV